MIAKEPVAAAEGNIMDRFDISSIEICFDSADNNYRDLRIKYRNASLAAGLEFRKSYSCLFADPATFAASLERQYAKYLNDGVNSAIEDLIRYDVIDIDDLIFIKHYARNHLTWLNDIESILATYNQLIATGESNNSDAVSGGPGIIGGGFGLEGMAQGIAIATAVNAVVGVASGLARAAGGGLRSFESKQRMQTLLSSPTSVQLLQRGIENLVFNIHRSIAEIITERNPKIDMRLISPDAEVRSEAILHNVKKGRFEGAKLEVALVQAIRANPYSEEAYIEWQNRGLPKTDGFVQMLAHLRIQIPERQEIEVPEPPQGQSASLQNQRLELNQQRVRFEKVLAQFKSIDFHAGNKIPARKSKGAKEKYFNSHFFASTPESGFRQDVELGELLALIDTTVLGSAEEGFAIGEGGFSWKDGVNVGAYTWEEFLKRHLTIAPGASSIKIGNRTFRNTSMIKNDMLAALLHDLGNCYQTSQLSP